MSLGLHSLCVGVLAHPVTSSQLYLHLLNKALQYLTNMVQGAASVLLVDGCTYMQVQVSSSGYRLLLYEFGLLGC